METPNQAPAEAQADSAQQADADTTVPGPVEGVSPVSAVADDVKTINAAADSLAGEVAPAEAASTSADASVGAEAQNQAPAEAQPGAPGSTLAEPGPVTDETAAKAQAEADAKQVADDVEGAASAVALARITAEEAARLINGKYTAFSVESLTERISARARVLYDYPFAKRTDGGGVVPAQAGDEPEVAVAVAKPQLLPTMDEGKADLAANPARTSVTTRDGVLVRE